MAKPKELTLTADGSTPWLTASQDMTHIAADGTFGGGTLALEKLRDGSAVPIRTGATPIIYSAEFDDVANLGQEETFRFTLSGSTAPNLIISANRVR